MPQRRKEKSYCLNCSKELLLKKYVNCNGKYNKKFCSRKCLSRYWRGDKHPAFKGGKFIDNSGYVHILVEGTGKYTLEHRYLMEKEIGRKLKSSEHVHHIDGKKSNNLIENLKLLTINEHAQLHGNKRKGVSRSCVQKFKIVNCLNDPIEVGEIISLLPKYRTYECRKCLKCNKLFWARKDSNTKSCSSRCGLLTSWNNGKYNNRKKKCLKKN